jgi:hypothetical protein
MPSEWTIDGVLRPKGALATLRSGIFDRPCNSEKPIHVVDPIDLDPAPVKPPKGSKTTLWVFAVNEGSCPFRIVALDREGRRGRGGATTNPGRDSGLKDFVDPGGIEIVCAGDGRGRCKGSYIVWIG